MRERFAVVSSVLMRFEIEMNASEWQMLTIFSEHCFVTMKAKVWDRLRFPRIEHDGLSSGVS